ADGDDLPEGAINRLGTLRWRQGSAVSFLAYTAAEKNLISTGKDGLFRVWDVQTGKVIRQFGKSRNQDDRLYLGITPDRKTIASCDRDSGSLWDVAVGKILRSFKPFKSTPGIDLWVSAMAFAPDGKSLFTLEANGGLQQWDTSPTNEIKQFGLVNQTTNLA